MESPTLTHLNGRQASEVFAEVFEVYSVVYAEPPYNQTDEDRESFRDRARQQFQQAGFDMVTARAGPTLTGFTYG